MCSANNEESENIDRRGKGSHQVWNSGSQTRFLERISVARCLCNRPEDLGRGLQASPPDFETPVTCVPWLRGCQKNSSNVLLP